MKKPSEMTVHELVEAMLDITDKVENLEPDLDLDLACSLYMEAAERLELAADGQGVGPTAL